MAVPELLLMAFDFLKVAVASSVSIEKSFPK